MRRKGSVLIALGVLLIAAALGLVCYNLQEQTAAAETSGQALVFLKTQIPTDESEPPVLELPEPEILPVLPDPSEIEIPDYLLNPDMEMPVLIYDGQDYIGTLSLPTLGLELPILSQWSYEGLKTAPCRYTGSAYQNNLVLMAHNYTAHFRTLPDIREGDLVLFTDVDGNCFSYEVAATETLMPTAIEEMTDSGWDLTLFTCTTGGSYRFTVRCQLID